MGETFRMPESDGFAEAEDNGSGPDFHAGAQESDGGGEPYQWADPQLLEDYLSPVLPLCPEMMPEPLGKWVADVAYRVRCPLDFVTVSTAVMTGSVCAARVRIRPGHCATWEIAPNLWGGVVGPSGSKKTPATSEIFKMLTRLEIEESDNHEKARAVHNAALMEHGSELKALRSTADKLRKQRLEGKSKPQDAEREDALKKQLEELLKNEPQPPTRRWFRINDPTIEALQDILKRDSNCILFERDELTGMLAQWEMEGHQMDRAFYLESHNGTNPYVGNRMGRGEFRLPLLCLSLFGGIQPVKLIQYLRNPQTNLTHDGAMQRFQALVYPDPPPKRKHVDQYENTEAKNRFYEILKKLAYADFRDYGGLTDEFNNTPWFHFHAEAKTLFEEWLAANEEKAENKNEDPALREHLSKFPKLFCGLSLIFHLIELADTGSRETYIPLRIAKLAAEWCAYLESHARRIYSLVKTPSLFSAMALADKLTGPTRTPLGNWFTAREVFRKQWSGVNTYELINAALARLEETNWIRSVVVSPSESGGRPTVRYEINPKIIRPRIAAGEAK
jgi:hypothetical protein